jgi:hypothetical protein
MKFYNIFNFFYKNEGQNDLSLQQSSAYIKYYTGGDDIKIDIGVEELDDKGIKNLALLINTLFSEEFFKETMLVIEDLFIKTNDYDNLLKLYASLNPQILKNKLNKTDNTPYIKPSEMIK